MITCLLHTKFKSVSLFRDGCLIGVINEFDNEPVIIFNHDFDETGRLSFDEIDIIQDNWNQMIEMWKKETYEHRR